MNKNTKPLNATNKQNTSEENYADTYPKYFWDSFGTGNNLGFDEEPEDLPPTPTNPNLSV